MTYHHTLAHRGEARAITEQMVALAERDKDTGRRAIALVLLGNCLWVEGQYPQAREALSQALSLYDADRQKSISHAYALDAKAWASMSLGPVLWSLGYPEQGLRCAEDALAWAEELKHTNSIGLSYLYLASVHHYNGDRDRTLAVTQAMIEFATRHGLSFNEAYGRILRGWATHDLEEPTRILGDHGATGQLNGMTFYGAAIAEVRAERGQHAEALADIDRYLELSAATGERYHLSALHRLRGSLLLELDPGAGGEASESFERAIEIAR
jgi:tetratricopeptide (TPR) repeat protein